MLLALLGCSCAASEQRFEYQQPAMGTLFRVVLYAEAEEQAGAAAAAAFARVSEIEARLSDYDPDSELSRLCALSDGGAMAQAVAVSPDLWRVLEEAGAVTRDSAGAFDVTVGSCVKLWRRAARQEELPAAASIEEARAAAGWDKVDLDPERRAVRLAAPGMRLDFGGIAKGYALDEALAVIAGHGLRRALVDGGGDLAAADPPPGRAGWRIRVEAGGVDQEIELCNAAVATSGDAYRYAEIGGTRYSHVVDPRSGWALTNGSSATVIARRAVTADAWATALCVLGPAGLAAAAACGEACVVTVEGGAARRHASAGFPRN